MPAMLKRPEDSCRRSVRNVPDVPYLASGGTPCNEKDARARWMFAFALFDNLLHGRFDRPPTSSTNLPLQAMPIDSASAPTRHLFMILLQCVSVSDLFVFVVCTPFYPVFV